MGTTMSECQKGFSSFLLLVPAHHSEWSLKSTIVTLEMTPNFNFPFMNPGTMIYWNIWKKTREITMTTRLIHSITERGDEALTQATKKAAKTTLNTLREILRGSPPEGSFSTSCPNRTHWDCTPGSPISTSPKDLLILGLLLRQTHLKSSCVEFQVSWCSTSKHVGQWCQDRHYRSTSSLSHIRLSFKALALKSSRC